MKYIMYEHAGAGNHGCEAIVRSTINMLGAEEYYLQTFSKNEDIYYGLNEMAKLVTLESKTPGSMRTLMMRVQSRISPDIGYDDRECLYRNSALLKRGAVALSIGGDNYCYAGIIHSMRNKQKAFLLKGIRTVLWGCSIDRTYLNNFTINDLKNYSLITARESLTVEVLNEVGICDSVVQCADPAFILPRETVSWNEKILNSGNVIGINVSDFMNFYDAYPDATYRNFNNLINHIINTTNSYVALIPHVRQDGNDDLKPIEKLANEIDSERVLIVEDSFNCMQLKDIIARCRLFIGCRTHSTIAAYSTRVPTLVVGYSIKAKGICKDLFGDYDGLLVDVRDFQSDNDLIYAYDRFCEREAELKKQLCATMDSYSARAFRAKEALKNRVLGE